MTAQEIVAQLEPLGTEGYRRILRNHGVPEPMFGVKVEELKKLQKAIKKDYRLALDLYETGIYDAIYLASLIADESKMTKEDLRGWLGKATSDAAAEYAVAWVAADGPHGWELAQEWIDSPDERSAVAGWGTLSGWVAVKPDSELDIQALRDLLQRVQATVHDQPNRVRYKMVGFVIALGSYVQELMEEALRAAEEIGTVQVDMGKPPAKSPPPRTTSARWQAWAERARSEKWRGVDTCRRARHLGVLLRNQVKPRTDLSALGSVGKLDPSEDRSPRKL
ncbi:MAG TPA: DNA alkylation repair protein [Fimbriimonas sp.]|nr:DNA alkylation repair protein [Fimbriimonas sp.]